jgi:hypothetical protein
METKTRWMIGDSIFDRFVRRVELLPDANTPDRRNGWQKVLVGRQGAPFLFVKQENLFGDFYKALNEVHCRQENELIELRKKIKDIEGLPQISEEGDI